MNFTDFISSLNNDNKYDFDNYSLIRGRQQYKIIYECLKRTSSNISYEEVKAFVTFDKAIKDIVFKYLGTLEEMIRNDIILRFNFAPDAIIKNEEYHYFKSLPKCVKMNNPSDEITDFYKKFALNFGDLVSFIAEYDNDSYDLNELKTVRELRNDVMHHSPLLFDYSFNYIGHSTLQKIEVLKKLLPKRYQNGLINNLKKANNETRKNVSKKYYEFLLFKE